MARRGRPPYPELLTPRQEEVLSYLREGLTDQQIAERLGVSLDGAKYHVSEILGKLGVRSRREAAAWQPERARWWPSVLAPLGLWRRAGFGAMAAAAAAVLAVAVAAGVGVLLWALVATRGEEAENVLLPAPSASPTVARRPEDVGARVFALDGFSADGAWALTERGLLRTADAGRTWTDVTPSDLRGIAAVPELQHRIASFFLDGERAWLAYFATIRPPPTPAPPFAPPTFPPPPVVYQPFVTLYHTIDGGTTWESGRLDLDAGKVGTYASSGSLFFLDDTTGWLTVTEMSSSAFSRGELYGTDDGGNTWTKVSVPTGQPVRFVTPADGWTAWRTQLHVTRDGARTWAEQEFAVPVEEPRGFVLPGLPHFFDEQNGVLPVWIEAEGPVFFLTTADGGRSWQYSSRVSAQFAGDWREPVFVDRNTWFLFADGLSATRDGGATWSPMQSSDEIDNARLVHFTSADIGWAYSEVGGCIRKGNCWTEAHLLRTEDGGLNWTEIQLD